MKGNNKPKKPVNAVGCMYNKDELAYNKRRLSRDTLLADVAFDFEYTLDKPDERPAVTDLYPMLYLDPSVSMQTTLSKFAASLRTAQRCNRGPYFNTCDDTLLCELCLSRRRYHFLKALEEYKSTHDNKINLAFRRHIISIPRGLFVTEWGHCKYLLYNSLIRGMSFYGHQLQNYQKHVTSAPELDSPQYANDMNTFMWAVLEGPMLFDPTKPSTVAKTIEERTLRLKDVRQEIMLGGRLKSFRKAAFTGDTLVMSILQTILMERTALSRRGYPGVCSRVVIYPSETVNCTRIELQSLIVGAPKECDGEEKDLLFFGGSECNNERKIRIMPGSDIYATSYLRTKYNRLSNSVANLHRSIDNLFTFNEEVNNFTPLELFMYTLGIKAYSDSITSSGLFRKKADNGKEKKKVRDVETGSDSTRSQGCELSEGSVSSEDC